MAINPFPRIQPLEITPALPSGARAPEGTFSNIASLGDAIGQYRERNAMGELLKGAIDPTTGVLDTNKAATLIALSGRDPTKYLSLAEAASRAKEASSYRQEALDIARQGRDIEERRFKIEEEKAGRPAVTIKGTGTPLDPYQRVTIDPRTGKATIDPLEGGQPPIPPPPPRAPVPGSSALPGGGGGPDVADISPAGFPGAPGPGSPFDPELAAPYRVAGPMVPPPTPDSNVIQAQATQPAAKPAGAIQRPDAVRPPPKLVEGITPEQEPWVEKYVHPQYQSTLRGVLNYSRDPYKIGDKREQDYIFKLANDLDPSWSPDEFARREKAKVGTIGESDKKALREEGGRLSQVLGFNQNWDDSFTVPGIAGYLGAGAASIGVGYSSPATAAKMLSFFQNKPGVTEDDALKAVNFWQGYRRYVNVVRNEQFGASLTPSEQKAFAEADISPGMDPRVIRENLDIQQKILRGAMVKTAQGLLAEGVPADRIEARLGVPLSSLREEPAAKPGRPNPDIDKYRNPPGMSAAVQRAQEMLQRFGDTPETRKAIRGTLDQIDPTGSLSKQMGM